MRCASWCTPVALGLCPELATIHVAALTHPQTLRATVSFVSPELTHRNHDCCFRCSEGPIGCLRSKLPEIHFFALQCQGAAASRGLRPRRPCRPPMLAATRCGAGCVLCDFCTFACLERARPMRTFDKQHMARHDLHWGPPECSCLSGPLSSPTPSFLPGRPGARVFRLG